MKTGFLGLAFFFCLIPFFFSGCGHSGLTEVKQIIVNFERSEDIRLNHDECTNFDIPAGIIDALLYKKSIVLVSQNNVVECDSEKGDTLFVLSCRGRREDEFVSIPRIWLRDNILEMYDFDSSKLLRFDLATGMMEEAIHIKNNSRMFSLLRWESENDRYIGVKTFEESPVQDLAVYDDSLRFLRYLDSPEKKSGVLLGHPLTNSFRSGTILYHQPFQQTIFRVRDVELEPAYVVDFGKNNFPKRVIEDEDEMGMYNYWKEHGDEFVLFSSNIIETKSNLFFTVVLSNEKYLVKYEFSDSSTRVFHFVLPEGERLFNQVFYNDYNKSLYFYSNSDNDGLRFYRIKENSI